MKKFMFILSVLVSAFILCGCAISSSTSTTTHKITIETERPNFSATSVSNTVVRVKMQIEGAEDFIHLRQPIRSMSFFIDDVILTDNLSFEEKARVTEALESFKGFLAIVAGKLDKFAEEKQADVQSTSVSSKVKMEVEDSLENIQKTKVLVYALKRRANWQLERLGPIVRVLPQ